ncbi:gle1 RNA export mediator isoform X2 [Lycorma delicatula]|uniref:gle1 RNA export mediator isoform X2 n=1 Tax=Lycorma delicatula TaxID=130591 RepID=UPI003F511BDC
MISPNYNFKVSQKNSTNTNIDIIEGINKLKSWVLTKACVLNGAIKDASIGPACAQVSEDCSYADFSPTDSFATSTPDQSINGLDRNGFDDSVDNNLSSTTVTDFTDGRKENSLVSSENRHSNCNLNISRRKDIYSKKLLEFEDERRDVITLRVKQKYELMVKEELKIQEGLVEVKQEYQLARAQTDLERTQKLLREEEDRASEAQKWKYFNEQRCCQRLNEANERIQKVLQKQQEAEERQKQHLKEKKMKLDKVHEYQILYRTAYQQLQEVTKTCKNNKDLFTALSNEAANLKATNERFETLVDNCKTGHVTQQELSEGEEIVKQIKEILGVFKKEVEAVNSRHENADKKIEEERLKKELKGKYLKENKETTVVKSESEGLDDCVDKESYQIHVRLLKFLQEYESSLVPLLNDESAKKFRFSCQRAINIPVNAISPISREHMQDKYSRLCSLLKGQPVVVSNNTITASSHPLGNQGEHTVSSKPEAAFAIAGIVVSLWNEFPDFGKLLLAHFQLECPYLIPAFMPQVEGQSNEDYYKVLGYQYIDGKVESQDKFLKRMSGMMRLYAAVIITQQHITVPHPLGLREGWRWLAATLNLEPRADITATLILDMLEVAGSQMWSSYHHQFRKLLHLLCTEFFDHIEQVTPDGCGGPVRRLKTFLEKVIKEQKISPPTGVLPRNIW